MLSVTAMQHGVSRLLVVAVLINMQVVAEQEWSKTADVYSLGIILWEMMTWQLPWGDMNSFQVYPTRCCCCPIHASLSLGYTSSPLIQCAKHP